MLPSKSLCSVHSVNLFSCPRKTPGIECSVCPFIDSQEARISSLGWPCRSVCVCWSAFSFIVSRYLPHAHELHFIHYQVIVYYSSDSGWNSLVVHSQIKPCCLSCCNAETSSLKHRLFENCLTSTRTLLQLFYTFSLWLLPLLFFLQSPQIKDRDPIIKLSWQSIAGSCSAQLSTGCEIKGREKVCERENSWWDTLMFFLQLERNTHSLK